jgi:hypothetical protein
MEGNWTSGKFCTGSAWSYLESVCNIAYLTCIADFEEPSASIED